jgi:FkbM family methyltransferase
MRKADVFYRNNSSTLFVHDRGDYISDAVFDSQSFFEIGILHLIYMNRAILNFEQSSVIDVGANIGNHSLFFENIIGFKEVYSIEPVSKNFELLQKNTTKSHLIKAACSSNHQNLTMIGETKNMGNFRIVESKNTVQNADHSELVSTIKLDDLRIFDVSLIKVDVEGHEECCLEGAMETIQRCKPMLWIESHTIDFIEKFSRNNQYKVVWSDNYINYILCPSVDLTEQVVYL